MEQYESGKGFWTSFRVLMNATESSENASIQSITNVLLGTAVSNTVDNIVRWHDVRDISHTEIQTIGQELFRLGAINSVEYRDFALSTLRVSDAKNPEAISERDKIDYLQLLDEK